ncbi:MAG: 50S ribosomal protein L30 [Bacteroidales bacterium]
MAKLKIKQVKSKIGSTKRQKLTLEALGIKKMNAVVEHEENPQILGMIAKVSHLVSVEKV